MPDLWKYTRAQSDTDAETFFAACVTAGTTLSAGQKTAIYGLVGGLKQMSLWSKMTALYPFVGGTAGCHAINLKTPGTYNITWAGTITHNSNGVTGNGSTGYGDTGITPSTSLSLNSCHCSVYNRTNTSADGYLIGCRVAGSYFGIAPKQSDGICYAGLNEALSASSLLSVGAGITVATRTTSTTRVVKVQSSPLNRVSATSSSLNNVSLYVLANNVSGVGAANFSAKNLAFSSIGSGLSDQDAQNLSLLVQSYQSALGRAV